MSLKRIILQKIADLSSSDTCPCSALAAWINAPTSFKKCGLWINHTTHWRLQLILPWFSSFAIWKLQPQNHLDLLSAWWRLLNTRQDSGWWKDFVCDRMLPQFSSLYHGFSTAHSPRYGIRKIIAAIARMEERALMRFVPWADGGTTIADDTRWRLDSQVEQKQHSKRRQRFSGV